MPQLGLAFPLEDEAISNDVRRMQLTIDRACGSNPALRIVPHVSLKQPFHVKKIEPVEQYFDQLAASTPAPQIGVGGVGSFAEGNVVYLHVVHGPELEALRLQVLADLRLLGGKAQTVEADRHR